MKMKDGQDGNSNKKKQHFYGISLDTMIVFLQLVAQKYYFLYATFG